MDVLVIDDEEGVRRFLCRVLEQMAHVPIEAADGRAALALFQARRIDLVVTDLNLPHQRDLETLVTLCKPDQDGGEEGRGPIPVIAITGGDCHDDGPLPAIARQADARLAKPFRRADFVACVTEVMRGAEHGRAAVMP